MKHCNAKSLARIASVVQQLLQRPLVVLLDVNFEVMRTLVALVMTILCMFYTVVCVQISYSGPYFNYRYPIDDCSTFLVS